MLNTFLEILNLSSVAITALATAILAFITWRYVVLTKMMLRSQDTPRVQVFVAKHNWSPGIYSYDLVIENIGRGVAHDIKFIGDLSSIQTHFGSRQLTEHGIIKNGIPYLGPGKQYRLPIFWQTRDSITDPVLPEEPISVEVTYKDSVNVECPLGKFNIDFANAEEHILKCHRLFRPQFRKFNPSFFVENREVSDTLTPNVGV